MTGEGDFTKHVNVHPFPVVKHSIFTPEEVEELKEIIRDTYKELQQRPYPY